MSGTSNLVSVEDYSLQYVRLIPPSTHTLNLLPRALCLCCEGTPLVFFDCSCFRKQRKRPGVAQPCAYMLYMLVESVMCRKGN